MQVVLPPTDKPSSSALERDHDPADALHGPLSEIIFGGLLEDRGDGNPDTNLFDSGLDSMAIMQLIIMVEEKFSVQIPASDVSKGNFQSIRALAMLIHRLAASHGGE